MLRILIAIIIILVVGAAGAYWIYQREISLTNSNYDTKSVFTVVQGESFDEIAENLEKSGLIRSQLFFKAYAWEKGSAGKIKAGEYELSPAMSILEIIAALTNGKTVSREVTVLIKEGENLDDIAASLERQGLFAKDDFFKAAGYPKVDYRQAVNYPEPLDLTMKYSFLSDKPKYFGMEGYLFPDTYRFFKDSTPEVAMLKMLDNFDRKLNRELREEIRKQGKTVYEILTMASLLEKEVQTEDDMKVVAGIFWNRIKIGQPLQSCATLAYILGVQKTQYSLEDTNIDSPYNTYRNQGLPPGPIGNPGLKAIRAAIYPTYTEYNYFLTAGDGRTVFAKTFEEHVRNKEKYLR